MVFPSTLLLQGEEVPSTNHWHGTIRIIAFTLKYSCFRMSSVKHGFKNRTCPAGLTGLTVILPVFKTLKTVK